MVFSSFSSVFANPLVGVGVKFAESKLAHTAMTAIISGIMVKDFGFATYDLGQQFNELGVSISNWKYGKYGNDKFGLSIPKHDMDIVGDWLVTKFGGYYSSHFFNTEPDMNLYNHSNFDNTITGTPYINALYYSQSSWKYKVLLKTTSGMYRIMMSNSPITYSGEYMYTSSLGVDYIYENDKCVSSADFNGSKKVGSTIKILDSLITKTVPVPPEVWNDNYIKEDGVNYDSWYPQPSGNYVVNIPTTKNELGEIVVDDIALNNQSPDIARVNDLITNVENVPINEVNPYNPNLPQTEPINNPITDVGSDTWIDRLWNKFIDMFILPESYFIDNFRKLQNEMPTNSFGYQLVEYFGDLGNVSGGHLNCITINYAGQTHDVVCFEPLNEKLPIFHNWVRGVIFVLLLFYNYDQLYKLIRGSSYGFSSYVASNYASAKAVDRIGSMGGTKYLGGK